MFAEYSFPFESNKQYKEYCLGDMKELNSPRIAKMKEYNTIYTKELVEVVQKLLIGNIKIVKK